MITLTLSTATAAVKEEGTPIAINKQQPTAMITTPPEEATETPRRQGNGAYWTAGNKGNTNDGNTNHRQQHQRRQGNGAYWTAGHKGNTNNGNTNNDNRSEQQQQTLPSVMLASARTPPPLTKTKAPNRTTRPLALQHTHKQSSHTHHMNIAPFSPPKFMNGMEERL